MTIAQAIKQGPSLPKVEVTKFSGDPLECAEFVTNFKDSIESRVADLRVYLHSALEKLKKPLEAV